MQRQMEFLATTNNKKKPQPVGKKEEKRKDLGKHECTIRNNMYVVAAALAMLSLLASLPRLPSPVVTLAVGHRIVPTLRLTPEHSLSDVDIGLVLHSRLQDTRVRKIY